MGRIVGGEMVCVWEIWTLRSSVIRNLGEAFRFGTLRVIEEDRKAGEWNRSWDRGIGIWQNC